MELHADGFVFRRNPSPIGGGWSVVWHKWPDPVKCVRHVVAKKGMTNNEAELRAVLCAVLEASPGDTVVTDSQNTAKWIEKGKCAARPDLTTHAQNAHAIIVQKRLHLQWRPRSENFAGQWNETQRPTEP